MSQIYKITYPNGKIYIGQDVTDTLTYFGSPRGSIVANDFPVEQRKDFTVRKQILWDSKDASQAEVNAAEIRFILEYRSNDPPIGYNARPRLVPPVSN